MNQLFRTKSIDALIASSEEPDKRLKKTLGVWSLIALGVGAVIGSGIFTVTGTAAAGEHFAAKSILKAPVLDLLVSGGNAATLNGRAGAGPAISVSFVLVAIACGFAAICYAELASMIPIAGSAYTYSYATLGEIFAWIIGWDLILEYAFSNMSVAVGFSAYFNDILDNLFGFHLPKELSQPIFEEGQRTGAWFNLPALLILLALSYILVRGVRESAQTNNAMVLIKVVAILLFVFGAMKAVNTGNWHPFMPNGYSGVLTGGAIVFFTYIGFDSVSTAAEECKKPQTRHADRNLRDIADLCAALRIGVAGADGNRQLVDVEQRRTRGQRAEGHRHEPPAADRHGGRAAGHAVVLVGVSIRTGAGMVRDVARSLAAGYLFARSPALQDAAHQHLGGGFCGGHSGRSFRHQLVFRSVEYRNAVRVHSGIGGSYSVTEEAARTAARVPGSLGSFFADGLDRLLPGPDAKPAA